MNIINLYLNINNIAIKINEDNFSEHKYDTIIQHFIKF